MGNHNEASNNLTPAVSTIAFTENSNATQNAGKVNKTVHFSLDGDTRKITADEARKIMNQNLKRNISGFALGVLASLFIAVSTSCTQVQLIRILV